MKAALTVNPSENKILSKPSILRTILTIKAKLLCEQTLNHVTVTLQVYATSVPNNFDLFQLVLKQSFKLKDFFCSKTCYRHWHISHLKFKITFQTWKFLEHLIHKIFIMLMNLVLFRFNYKIIGNLRATYNWQRNLQYKWTFNTLKTN